MIENLDTMILAADHSYKMDYGQMLDFHLKTNADVTNSVIPVLWELAPQFGILTT
jgi:glucose-1-phosphate adenylyltransferase